jgi:hypothetical protein
MAQSIFEAANETLKEFFIGVTTASLDQLEAGHRAVPPAPVSHWDFSAHRIVYREVEHDLPGKDSRPFIDGYVQSIEKNGWKVITE